MATRVITTTECDLPHRPGDEQGEVRPFEIRTGKKMHQAYVVDLCERHAKPIIEAMAAAHTKRTLR
jgi:hypothetical protein